MELGQNLKETHYCKHKISKNINEDSDVDTPTKGDIKKTNTHKKKYGKNKINNVVCR